MFTRALMVPMGALALVAVLTTPVEAQLSGRVVLREGPVAVDVVFGPQWVPTGRYRVVRREARAPVRYRPGMSLWDLERYLERVELEYELFRRMDPRDAYYDYGWSRKDLRDYVHFLRDERRFLRAERDRLYEGSRFERRGWERPGRGKGRGKGRGLGRGPGHGR